MYNEESNVAKTVTAIQETMSAFPDPWELVLVNDGSIDDTLVVAQEWESKVDNLRVVSYPLNQGRGKALRTGFANAWGKYLVSIDFDLSYSPNHILQLYDQLKADERVDIVLGSAYMPGGQTIGVRPLHLFLSKTGNRVLSLAFGGRFSTITCVLRGYKKEALDTLVLEEDRKEIHLEILSKAVALGYNIKEVPAVLRSRKRGSSKTRLGKTSITHLLFSVFERPLLWFSLSGLGLIVGGIILGIYVTYLRFTGNLNAGRPAIDLLILLIIVGVQLLSFGVIAGQNSFLRNEVYKLQSRLKTMERQQERDE